MSQLPQGEVSSEEEQESRYKKWNDEENRIYVQFLFDNKEDFKS